MEFLKLSVSKTPFTEIFAEILFSDETDFIGINPTPLFLFLSKYFCNNSLKFCVTKSPSITLSPNQAIRIFTFLPLANSNSFWLNLVNEVCFSTSEKAVILSFFK